MKSFKILIFSLAAIWLACFMNACNNSKTGNSPYMVVAYIAGFRDFDFNSIDASKLTHINYAFANILNGEVKFDTSGIDNSDLKSEDISVLNNLKKVNPQLKILISVGGWGWSGNFSDAALTDSTRNRFAKSAVDFIIENKLDGIDLDWEYPNQVGAGNVYRKEDVKNFTLLLREIRLAIDSIAYAEGRDEKYLLTIATGADSVYIVNTELGEIARYVDFINIMSYDLHNGLTSQAGHHTNLYISPYDTPYGDATEHAVNMHLQAGVPPSKINIGIPFYGRMWKGVIPENNGLYQEAGTTGQSISYREVMEALMDNKYERYWDTIASAPWLWNSTDSVFISYDDAESIAAKMEYVKKMKIGGVMYWEYSEDINEMLLDGIVKGLHRK